MGPRQLSVFVANHAKLTQQDRTHHDVRACHLEQSCKRAMQKNGTEKKKPTPTLAASASGSRVVKAAGPTFFPLHRPAGHMTYLWLSRAVSIVVMSHQRVENAGQAGHGEGEN